MTIGGVDVLLIAGDGSRPIPAECVTVRVSGQRMTSPPDIAAMKQEIVAVMNEKRAQRQVWNNPCCAVAGLEVFGNDGRIQEVVVDLHHADYFDFCASQDESKLSLSYIDETGKVTTLSDKYGEDIPRIPETAYLAPSFAAVNVVRTLDGKLIYTRRSDKVDVAPGQLNVSANGGLDLSSLPNDGSPVDLFELSKREENEELGISDNERESIELLGIIRSPDNGQHGAVFLTQLNITYAELEKKWQKEKPASWWENGFVTSVSSDLETMIPLLYDPEAKWTWCGPPGFYLALVREHGAEAVDAAIANYLSRRQS